MDDDETPISHLQRRKIEGRVLLPFIQACRRRFGDDATRALIEEVIGALAAGDGARWAEAYGADMAGLKRVSEEVFAGGGSLELDILDASDEALAFDVTRCRYAEFWQELGLAEIGY